MLKRIIFLLFIITILATKNTWGALTPCPAPAQAGQQRYNPATGAEEFCDGTNWRMIGAPEYVWNGCQANDSSQTYVPNPSGLMDYCKNSIRYVSNNCYRTPAACFGIPFIAGQQVYNTAKNMMQYCDGNNWMDMGSDTTNHQPCCPDGFIPVPADPTEGTSQDFCVSKYHMKAVLTATGVPESTGVVAVPANYYPESRYDAQPWVGLSFDQAVDMCGNLGATLGFNMHLITNAEWMTIAKNIENTASNWSGNAVGSGYIPIGHSDNVPNNSLPADINDPQGCSGTGNANCWDKASLDYWQKRTLTLSNGQTIWDFTGNVNSWVSPNVAANHGVAQQISYLRSSIAGCGATCTEQLDDDYNLNPLTGKYIGQAPILYPPNNSTNKFAYLPSNDTAWAPPPTFYIPYKTPNTLPPGPSAYDQYGFGKVSWLAGGGFASGIEMYRGGNYSLNTAQNGPGGLYSAWIIELHGTSGINTVGFRCVYVPPN